MCLLGIAWRMHPRFALVLIANRDEFHARPAAPLAPWPEPPGMFAGRDLQAGGTWLAVDRTQRLGVVTNFRELQRPRRDAPSRGGIIPQYFAQPHPPGKFLRALKSHARAYAGFNVLLGDAHALWYASNRIGEFARPLPPGLYGLSNHVLDSPWPKLERTRVRLQRWLKASRGDDADAAFPTLFEMLADRTPAEPDPALAGLPRDLEAAISAPFVVHPSYGTRCSTLVLIDGTAAPPGVLHIAERRFDAAGALAGVERFSLNPAP
ncbi:MAG TPA: NRDE family protein [Steroidobacteraceae bacterium]